MVRPALLVVDMVNDFVTGVFGNPRSQAMVPRLADLLDRTRADGVPVIYCRRQAGDGRWPERGARAAAGDELTSAGS